MTGKKARASTFTAFVELTRSKWVTPEKGTFASFERLVRMDLAQRGAPLDPRAKYRISPTGRLLVEDLIGFMFLGKDKPRRVND